MKRPEVILLFLIAFFIFWVYTCVAYPFIAFIVSCLAFVMFLGFLVFVLISLWYEKR